MIEILKIHNPKTAETIENNTNHQWATVHLTVKNENQIKDIYLNEHSWKKQLLIIQIKTMINPSNFQEAENIIEKAYQIGCDENQEQTDMDAAGEDI